jgi:hypothetical protein
MTDTRVVHCCYVSAAWRRRRRYIYINSTYCGLPQISDLLGPIHLLAKHTSHQAPNQVCILIHFVLLRVNEWPSRNIHV